MKLSAFLQKQAMPKWKCGGITLEIEVVDFKELICKLHVKIDNELVGNIFLENQGKRIFRANFEHKKLSIIRKFAEDERKDIEREFGYLLYLSKQFSDTPFLINKQQIKLNLKSSKRQTRFINITDTNGDFKNRNKYDWGEILKDKKYEFDEKGLWFQITESKWYLIPYNDLLFHQ